MTLSAQLKGDFRGGSLVIFEEDRSLSLEAMAWWNLVYLCSPRDFNRSPSDLPTHRVEEVSCADRDLNRGHSLVPAITQQLGRDPSAPLLPSGVSRLKRDRGSEVE